MPERDRNDQKRKNRIERALASQSVRSVVGRVPGPDLSDSNEMAMFREIRKYIEHEDNIINARTTWFMTFNSFMFGGFSLVVVGMAEQSASEETKQLQAIIVLLFSVIGVALAVTTNLSVRAAYSAIRKLRIFWTTHYEPLDLSLAAVPFFPHIIGGGPNERVALKGRILSLWMPFWTGSAWLIIGLGAALRLVSITFGVSFEGTAIFAIYANVGGFGYLLMLYLIEKSSPEGDD